jgi:hypothetical protein
MKTTVARRICVRMHVWLLGRWLKRWIMNPPQPDPTPMPQPLLNARGVNKILYAATQVKVSNEREAAILGAMIASLLYRTVIDRKYVAAHTARALAYFGMIGEPATPTEMDEMTLRFRNVYCPSDRR